MGANPSILSAYVRLCLTHIVETQNVALLHWEKAGTSPAATLSYPTIEG